MNTETISIVFSLRPIEVEATEKVASMIEHSDVSERRLLTVCAERFSDSEMEEMHKVLSFAKSLESTDPNHPSMHAYISHPLRVARMALQLLEEPSLDIVSMGLLHNVFEVSGLAEADVIEAGFASRIADGVRCSTVDRKLQFDESYLAEFYGRIMEFGDDLVLIKCVDKLDNLLAFQLIDGPVREPYLEATSRFVKPMADHISPAFGDYFGRVIEHMRSVGCDQELKAQYEAFKTQN